MYASVCWCPVKGVLGKPGGGVGGLGRYPLEAFELRPSRGSRLNSILLL